MNRSFFYIFLLLLSFQFSLKAQESYNFLKIPTDSKSSLRGIFAVSENEAWFSGSEGTVMFTSDGGKNFIKIVVPGNRGADFRDIHVIDGDTVILLSVGNGEKSRIFSSDDKGKSWALAYINKKPQGFLNSVDFWDSKNGLGVGDPVDGRFQLLRTTDSGRSWKSIPGPVALKGEAGFAASGTCIRVWGKGHAWIVSGGKTPFARVHRSSDEGQTWKVSNTNVLSGKSSTGIFSVLFLNRLEGIVVGGDYLLEGSNNRTYEVTDDGGRSWKSHGDFFPVFQSATGKISYNGKAAIITAGPEGIYLKDSHGNWDKVSDNGYHCLSVAPGGKCVWLAGSKGRIGMMKIHRD